MARIITSQASTNRPTLIAVAGLPADFTTILEAPDYSVPDATVRWPGQRDPLNAARRIQPGQAIFVTPICVHNRDVVERWVEFQILTEAGDAVKQALVTIPPGETYLHPIAGLTLTKTDLESENGDRMQARSEVIEVLDITASAAIGSAEQDQPAGV